MFPFVLILGHWKVWYIWSTTVHFSPGIYSGDKDMGLLLPDSRWFSTLDILADNCEKEPWITLFYFCGTPQSQFHRISQVTCPNTGEKHPFFSKSYIWKARNQSILTIALPLNNLIVLRMRQLTLVWNIIKEDF